MKSTEKSKTLRQIRKASPLRKGKMNSGSYSLFRVDGAEEEVEHEQVGTASSHFSHSGPESNLPAKDQQVDTPSQLLSPREEPAKPKQAFTDGQGFQDRRRTFVGQDDLAFWSNQNKILNAIDSSQEKPTSSEDLHQKQESNSQLSRDFRKHGTFEPFYDSPSLLIDPHASQMQPQMQKEEEPHISEASNLYFGDLDNLRTAKDGICRNIHILGTGNIGKFIAHSLAEIPNGPKITLLLHRPRRIQDWYDEGQAIVMYTKKEPSVRTGFAVESSTKIEFSPNESYPAFGPNLETSIVPPTTIIDHLIVTAKATKIISALESVKNRLRPTSTICLIHNGMGVMEQINKEVFPNPVTRPNLVFGTISHGVGSVEQRKFSCTYNGNGVLNICNVDRYHNDDLSSQDRSRGRDLTVHRKSVGYPPTTRYLMRTLTSCVPLKASGHSYNKFILTQLEKLAVNAIINPLTVIYDCKNKGLLHNDHISNTIHSLLREISAVILALPELSSGRMSATIKKEALQKRFSVEMLYTLVVGVANKTGWNVSSTLQDARKGEKTEIGYINGYIVKRGMELGIATVVNQFVLDAVIGKQKNVRKEVDGYVPFKSGKL